ncbi:MAG: hypothetical protein ACYC1L_15775 [Alphaproteobacteria bacterium]
MPTGQAFIDLLANTAVNFDPNLARPFVVDRAALRRIARTEQAALAAASQLNRRDEGIMKLKPLGGGPIQPVPTIVVLGADGPATGGDGIAVSLVEPALHGRILIVIGGSGVPANPGPTRGGGAVCFGGGGDGLVVALSGHGGDGGAPIGVGGNGCDGGRAGEAVAVAFSPGAVVVAEGGKGGTSSMGAPGAPGWGWIPGAVPFVGGRWIVPPIPAGIDGLFEGAGGNATAVGSNHTTYECHGGPATMPAPAFGGLTGVPGPPAISFPGLATAVYEPPGSTVTCVNGDGSAGTRKPR